MQIHLQLQHDLRVTAPLRHIVGCATSRTPLRPQLYPTPASLYLRFSRTQTALPWNVLYLVTLSARGSIREVSVSNVERITATHVLTK